MMQVVNLWAAKHQSIAMPALNVLNPRWVTMFFADMLKGLISPLTKFVLDERDRIRHLPTSAREAFDRVLIALEETFSAVDSGVKKFMQLRFDTTDSQAASESILSDITSGQFKNDLAKARFHCSSLYTEYVTYIRDDISNIVTVERAAELEKAFQMLQHADGDILDFIAQVDSICTTAAETMLTSSRAGNATKARETLALLYPDLQKLRQRLRDAMVQLSDARLDLNGKLVDRIRLDVWRLPLRSKLALSLVGLVVIGILAWQFIPHKRSHWYLTKLPSVSTLAEAS